MLLDNYYPPTASLVSAFPAAMRYAGPREAIWHAICRKNYGCSHFIVGRDHAGVGTYYGTYDAQLIFDEFEPHELGIEPMFFEHSFWCRVCGSDGVAEDLPARRRGPRVPLGDQGARDARRGELPPVEFTRPEVAEVLIEAYRSMNDGRGRHPGRIDSPRPPHQTSARSWRGHGWHWLAAFALSFVVGPVAPDLSGGAS